MALTEIIRHEVPIAIRALKTANIYEIKSDRHILVDTGMSPASVDFLLENGVDMKSLDMVVMTHLHIDHIGGAEAIRDRYGTPLSIGEEDAKRVALIRQDPEAFKNFLLSQLEYHGTPADLLSQIVGRHSVLDNVGLYHDIEFDRMLHGDEKISSDITTVSNPGHSPGSMSLMVGSTRDLLTGDHLLPGITPNISFYDRDSDMLGLYLASLKNTRELDASRILPGHRDPFNDAVGRIDEILHHHDERLSEILSVAGDWSSAFQVASRIRWSRGRKLDSMNLMEMNFAIGEAISHLTHLANTGALDKKEVDGVALFRADGHDLRSS